MHLPGTAQFRRTESLGSFDMTAVIDIVFLLIIFFLVVSQFIQAENFPVAVPDGCEFAQSNPEPEAQVTTLTVTRAADDQIIFAVNAEDAPAGSDTDTSARIGRLAKLIDARLQDLPSPNRIVTLRIDKDIPYSQAQYALAAVAQSTTTNVKLAVIRGELVSQAGLVGN